MFDWPFINTRCKNYNISLEQEIGFVDRDG